MTGRYVGRKRQIVIKDSDSRAFQIVMDAEQDIDKKSFDEYKSVKPASRKININVKKDKT